MHGDGWVTVVIISQYTRISNHYAVHMKRVYNYMLVILQGKDKDQRDLQLWREGETKDQVY